MGFMLGKNFLDCSPQHFKSKVAVLDAMPFVAPSSSSPLKTAPGLAGDKKFWRLRAEDVARLRAQVAERRGCAFTDVKIWCAGTAAKLVGRELDALHSSVNIHGMQHPEVAIPSPGRYNGAVLPQPERRLRAIDDDGARTKIAVHSNRNSSSNSNSSSGSIGVVTAFTRCVDKHSLTQEEYDDYIEGCRRGGMFKH
jgi:hypothetical protein